MPPRLFYELRIFQGDREIRFGPKPREALDWDDVPGTRRLLARHLLGAVERNGDTRDKAHLYHLEVRPIKANGEVEWALLAQFALPYDDDREDPSWR